jgi:transcriptional regulator with XRE-family HTH domain
MSSKVKKAPTLTSLETVHAGVLRESRKIRQLWDETAPRRKISMMLVEMRRKAGLSQKQIAEVAGWNKGYVSRLESALDRTPDTTTLARYAAACGMSAGFVIGEKVDPKHVLIHGAITLAPDTGHWNKVQLFEKIANAKVKLPRNVA